MASKVNHDGGILLTKREVDYLTDLIDNAWEDLGKERTLTSFRDVVSALDAILSTAGGWDDEG